ncbi:DegT/DnrJ/EryC1/StrS family aminotransferase [Mesorhizobium sp. 131-2-1]|uniref:DegT/DnrJ/EryC1/StrS family aminotransferase n=1 Tax=Mesorhizobium sp. 131-2-1 TaxID=2744518 RepID=UPI0018ED337D|nr:DegT/DnrJ/EryC1/StrS family aminotransferase [Mesorhizobium sp. 131-2-1]BCG97828.1 aminotransferase DegT [Mesorhizobium sp. 131-2-1]
MVRPRFTGSFTQQPSIPDEAIAAAVAVMRSGRLHRYNIATGEESETMALEREYASWQGSRYCIAVASGGQAMQIALRAAGVLPQDAVLTNGFTLAPVPGAIAAVGCSPILIEITEDMVIDLDDLAVKARQTGARHLLLSHMRGHQCDMDRLVRLAADLKLAVIEDCAHTMGATWNGRRSGAFGLAGCFSTQTYKHLNSGEGGLLTSDDAEFIARATILSGSYMLYERHGAGPGKETFADIRLDTPNMSARMDNLRAALLRPQLRMIDESIRAWNERHDYLARRLAACSSIQMPHRPDAEAYVGSSIQFLVPGISSGAAREIVDRLAEVGVELKWFGAEQPVGFTSDHHSWRYAGAQSLPITDAILSGLFDMRLPLTFSLEDCALLADHILDTVAVLASKCDA